MDGALNFNDYIGIVDDVHDKTDDFGVGHVQYGPSREIDGELETEGDYNLYYHVQPVKYWCAGGVTECNSTQNLCRCQTFTHLMSLQPHLYLEDQGTCCEFHGHDLP